MPDETDLTLPEAALLAGLPKGPSTFNPVVNPKRARSRQIYVLGRMRALDFISDAQSKAAEAAQLQVRRDINDFGVRADYVAEMARQCGAKTGGPERPDAAARSQGRPRRLLVPRR